jgi:hypothetical protein
MSEAVLHDRRILLADDCASYAGVAAHYLEMVGRYSDVNDVGGIKYSLKSATLHIKAAIQSFKELEQLNAPASSECEGEPA